MANENTQITVTSVKLPNGGSRAVRQLVSMASWALGIAFGQGELRAQVIEGRLSDASDGTPMTAVFVVLASDSAGEIARSVTTENGSFRLPVPQEGRYVLRAELVGFEASPSREFDASLRGTTRIDYATDLTPIRLTVGIDSMQTCQSATAPEIAPAWNESIKALRSIRETTRRQRLSLRARLYQRLSNAEGRVIRETDSMATSLHQPPFVEYAPADVTRRVGYTIDLTDGSQTYAVPTPADLAGDAFQRDHCFRLTPGPTAATVALHFQPADSGAAGLRGNFVLDRETAELRRADFRFTPTIHANGPTAPSASVEFVRVSASDRFVRSWQLRTPIFRSPSDTSGPVMLGFDETGAQILDGSGPSGNQVWTAPIGVLYGSVFDSLENAPLQGGVVALSGTRHWAQTDANGDFAMAGYWAGSYDVVFGHPRLDSLGFIAQPRLVDLSAGSETTISLAVPPLQTVLARRCPNQRGAGGRKMLVGVVRDEETEQPITNALVSISRDLIPQEFQVFVNERSHDVVVTDTLGMYTVCDIPIGLPISVTATAGAKQSSFFRTTFWEDGVTYGDGPREPLAYPVGRLDLIVRDPAAYSGAITGVVTDGFTGAAISGVNVTAEGTTQSVSTDSSGLFNLPNLPSGPVRLNLRKLGYRMLRHPVNANAGEQVILSSGALVMEPADAEAVTLDPITVEARGVAPKLSEFEERRSRGLGAFATKEDFEDWHPSVASDVLRRMRGVRVRPNPFYGINGDTRRNLIEPSRDIGQRVTRVISANEARGLVSSSGGDIVIYECPMLLFFDGVYLGDSYGTDVDNIISTTDLSAVEVYSPSQVPAQFALPGAACGVVVFWSY